MRFPRALAAVLALACAAALGACDARDRAAAPGTTPAAATPPEQEESLDALVPSLVDAVQAKQGSFVLEHVARSFKEDGGLDYYDVRALLEKYTLGEGPVGARLEKLELTPDGDGRQRAATLVAFASGQRLAAGAPLPEGGVVYAVEIVFAKEGKRWQAVGGRYKRVSPPAISPSTPETATR
jgi:hypothetical protein